MSLIAGLIGIGTGVALIVDAVQHDLSHHPSHLWVNVAIIAGVGLIGPSLMPDLAGSFSQYVGPLAAIAAVVCLATGQWVAFGGMLLAATLGVLGTRLSVAVLRARFRIESEEFIGALDAAVQDSPEEF